MKLSEAITRAVTQQDARAAGVVVDACRFCLGMTYDETLARVQQQHPEVTRASWDALLYEADVTNPLP